MSGEPENGAHPEIIRAASGLGKRGRGQRLALAVLAVVGLAAATLPWVPELLAISWPPPTQADAIYVFPGQVPERAECGAQLYAQGVAPVVVFTGGSIDAELEAVGMRIDDATLNARIAEDDGVPAGAEVLLHGGSSTWEDAQVLGAWMARSGARRVVAVTSPTHSRRAQYALWLALGDLGDDVRVYRCGTIYGPLWWTQERSLVRVTLEALKLGFYSIRYFLPALLRGAPEPPEQAPAAASLGGDHGTSRAL